MYSRLAHRREFRPDGSPMPLDLSLLEFPLRARRVPESEWWWVEYLVAVMDDEFFEIRDRKVQAEKAQEETKGLLRDLTSQRRR